MLFLDTIGCTASSDGIWIARRDGVLFAQVLQTFPQLIIVWSTTCCWRFVHIHKVPGILLVWHRLRDSFCYWSHPSVVGTPGTECGACIALFIAGIPTKLKKELSLRALVLFLNNLTLGLNVWLMYHALPLSGGSGHFPLFFKKSLICPLIRKGQPWCWCLCQLSANYSCSSVVRSIRGFRHNRPFYSSR